MKLATLALIVFSVLFVSPLFLKAEEQRSNEELLSQNPSKNSESEVGETKLKNEREEKRRAFISELAQEAAGFRQKLAGIKDEKEKKDAIEEFRRSRSEKIKAFLNTPEGKELSDEPKEVPEKKEREQH